MKKTLALLLAIAATQAIAQRTTYTETYRVGGNQTVPAIRNQGQLTVVPPGTPVMPPNAAAARSRINVRPLNFNNGQAHISGAIRGLGIAAYHFSGVAGQSIRMVPNSKNFAMEFALFNPEMGMRFGAVHTLPYSGDYEVRIVQNHKNAAHSKKKRNWHWNLFQTLCLILKITVFSPPLVIRSSNPVCYPPEVLPDPPLRWCLPFIRRER